MEMLTYYGGVTTKFIYILFLHLYSSVCLYLVFVKKEKKKNKLKRKGFHLDFNLLVRYFLKTKYGNNGKQQIWFILQKMKQVTTPALSMAVCNEKLYQTMSA